MEPRSCAEVEFHAMRYLLATTVVVFFFLVYFILSTLVPMISNRILDVLP